LECYFPIEVIN